MKRVIVVLAAATMFVAVASGATAAKPKPKHKPLPTPSFKLSASLSGKSIKLVGGFTLKGKPLKTVYRWTEQEFDASKTPDHPQGNPLPLDPQVGYTGFHQSPSGN